MAFEDSNTILHSIEDDTGVPFDDAETAMLRKLSQADLFRLHCYLIRVRQAAIDSVREDALQNVTACRDVSSRGGQRQGRF